MNGWERNPTARFSDRVENYVRYRPGYPAGVIATLENSCGMTAASDVADIGSGTGILTRMLLENGNRVTGVEPNREMREAAEGVSCGFDRFTSVAGSAEETGLPEGSVDLIVVGQAFHWFERDRAKVEFLRVLRRGGRVALIWNERNTTSSPFLQAYESLLRRHATDYHRVNHMNIDTEVLRDFFAPGRFSRVEFHNSQHFDLEGLKGRCLSSSYVPAEGQTGHEETLAEVEEIFRTHEQGGRVEFTYRTSVHHGSLRA